MAKAKKRKKSQSDRIRDYLKAHPNAQTSEIAKTLKVTPNLVYSVKGKMNGKTTKKKVATKKKTAAARAPAASSNGVVHPPTISDDVVLLAAELYNKCGSVEQATRVLQIVGRVADTLKA